jgi:uncharacterized protein YdaU (DUF1376 family)
MRSPAFQFYPADWLGSQRVTLMTLEEEGAYIRLLCYCWTHGSVPADPAKAARLVGKGASTTLATTVLTMFQADGGIMVHDRLEMERKKQADWREKSAAGGRASAEKRKNTKGKKGGSRVVQPPRQPNGNSTVYCLPSSACDLPSSAPVTPTLDEVIAYGALIGAKRETCESFFHGNESRPLAPNGNWTFKEGGEIRRWKSALAKFNVSWKGNDAERQARNGKPAGCPEREKLPPPPDYEKEMNRG